MPAVAASHTAGHAPWELRGTIVTHAPAGVALVERDGHQRWCRVHTTVSPGTTLVAVYPTYVRVRNSTGEHVVNFGAPISGRPPKPHGPYRLTADDLPVMMKRVQLIPLQKNGHVVGYYANHVDKKIRARIGLRPGDVIVSVDGIHLNENVNIGHLYRTVLSKGGAQVEVRRHDRTLNLRYRIR